MLAFRNNILILTNISDRLYSFVPIKKFRTFIIIYLFLRPQRCLWFRGLDA